MEPVITFLVTAQEMRAFDNAAIAGEHGITPVPSRELMRRAGAGVAGLVRTKFLDGPEASRRVTIFCGSGNNGGDGFVAAGYLRRANAEVRALCVVEPKNLTPDALDAYNAFVRDGGVVSVLQSAADIPQDLSQDVIIDALLGTGSKGAPHGLIAACVRAISASGAPVIAIDIPTGLDADGGAVNDPCIRARWTCALGFPKRGLYLWPGKGAAGNVTIVDIGIDAEYACRAGIRIELITAEFVVGALPVRAPTAHKGDCGRLFVLAGSRGLAGAGALCARAACRSGAGLCALGCPASLQEMYMTKLDETTTVGLPEVATRGVLAVRALGEIQRALGRANALAIGPGLGRHHETAELIRRLVRTVTVPFVLDADGLNAFEKDASALEGAHAPGVLTPHAGEFRRLTGEEAPTDFDARCEALRKMAKRFGSVVLLKGAPTLVADVDGQVYLSPTGNAGLATGGTGDVLTGVIGALLAQGSPPLSAALCGAYIHGLAGEIASERYGQRAMIAGDVIDALPEAYGRVEGIT